MVITRALKGNDMFYYDYYNHKLIHEGRWDAF